MVNPINGDKPLAASTERAGVPAKNSRTEQVQAAASRVEREATEAVDATLDVDQARQLYAMESQRSQSAGSPIDSPQAARSLVDRLIQQIGSAPQQALMSQASGVTAPLAELLRSAPA